MKAVAVSAFGALPELIDLPIPTPGQGEVLVRLHAAGVNPFDWALTDGMLKDAIPHHFPLVMGVDGAGVVEAVGADVTEFRPGDEVYGQFMNPAAGAGSYAEYGIASPALLARAPKGLILSQAAAVPTASMTAFNAVEEARVDEGQTVLIIGATGGVGQAATQFADARGAHVIVTAGPDAAPLMRELGADETIDHRAGLVADQVSALHPDGVDVLLNLVEEGATFDKSVNVLRPGGMLLTTRHAADVDALAAREIHAINFANTASSALLQTLADLLDAGQLRVRIDAEVPLEQAPAAVARARSGGARGKTVIKTA